MIIPKAGAVVKAAGEVGNVNAQRLDYIEKMLRLVAEGIVHGLEMNDFEVLLKS